MSLTAGGGDGRSLDERPVQDRYTIPSKRKVFLSNVIAGIEVSMKVIATFAAKEDRLRTAIGAMPVATARTGLAGMPGIDLDHPDAPLLCLVGRETVQLGKCPIVQSTFIPDILVPFATPQLRCLSNVGEILENEECASRGSGNEAFTQDMVYIPVEARLPLAKLFQVAFGRLRSVGLQFATKTKRATVNLFPVRRAEKLAVGGHGGAIESQVNADDYIGKGNSRLRNSYHHMQPPFAFAEDEISRGNRVPCILATPVGNSERQANLAPTGRQASFLFAPVEGKRFRVVADRTKQALRHFDGLELRDGLSLLLGCRDLLLVGSFMFHLPGEGAFESFGCLDAGLNKQVRDQPRTGGFRVVVRGVVQFDSILFMMLPAVATDMIEGISKLSKRLTQRDSLLWCGMHLYTHGSVHIQVFFLARKRTETYMASFLM